MIPARLLFLAMLLGGCAATQPAGAPATSAMVVGHPTTAELVVARQAGMHMAATLLFQGVNTRAKGVGDLKDVHYSEGLERWAAAIPGLFPPGSAHPQSRALAAIWPNKPDFDRKADAMAAAAREVTAAGKANDLSAYTEAAERLRHSCTACHQAYRAERN